MEERIRSFIDDGWNFRVKRSKGRRYITRRRGQVERSLGPYSEELWNLIQRLLEEKSRPPVKQAVKEEDFLSLLDSLINTIRSERSVKMMAMCKYKDEEGFCAFWTRDVKPSYYQILERLDFQGDILLRETTVEDTKGSKWMVKARPWFCEGCSAFEISEKK